MPLEVKYLKAIWAAARERGISAEEVHDAAWAGWEKKSLRDLTKGEALQLLDGLRGKKRTYAPRGDWRRRQAQAYAGRKRDAVDDPEQLVTDEEVELLWRIAYTMNWSAEAYRKFCARQCGVERPRTMREYNKVLWPLKAIQKREYQRGAA